MGLCRVFRVEGLRNMQHHAADEDGIQGTFKPFWA